MTLSAGMNSALDVKPRRSLNITVPIDLLAAEPQVARPACASTWSTTVSGTKRENTSRTRSFSNAATM